MSNLMFCEHKHIQPRRVSWATDCKGKHSQGFIWAWCCVKCGHRVRG